jgi:glucan phosphoethanolaminetransferase (alkaline phosphatase superfamily)
MSSNFKYRGYGFALLAILPLLINEMIGFPKATPILLFPASVCVIYFVLKRLERTRFPLAKDANSGIKLMFLGLATLTFLPLMLSQNNPTGKIQAVLFISYVPLLYVLLLLLEKANRRGSVTVALGAVIFSAVNAIYHGLTGGHFDYNVFASILDTHSEEAVDFLSSAFSIRFALLMVASLVVILTFYRLTRNIIVGRRFSPTKVTHAVLLAIPLSGMLHLSQSKYEVTNSIRLWRCINLYDTSMRFMFTWRNTETWSTNLSAT